MKSEELENQEERCSAIGEEDNQVIIKNNEVCKGEVYVVLVPCGSNGQA